MKKLLFISNIASPNQVKFCEVLQQYFKTKFWFYEPASAKRPGWWDIPLGANSQIFPNCYLKRSAHYFFPGIVSWLNNFQPDILLLGGMFYPSNIIAYFWALIHKKKIYFVSETLRKYQKKTDGSHLIYSGFKISLMKLLFRHASGIIATNDEARTQISKLNIVPDDSVITLEYPNDINPYFNHKMRNPTETCTILFANRLIDKYDPLFALRVFMTLSRNNCDFKMVMNNEGCLKQKCLKFIAEHNISGVTFLGEIQSWDDLHKVYESSDIFLLPARFSNGNFSIIEAMASGMGIIISKHILGSGFYIKNNTNGFRCELNVETFSKAIYSYLDNLNLFSEYTEVNRKIARTYSMNSLAKKYYMLLS